MPLILTQNEVTVSDAHDWKDIEGVQYHYPTKYRNKIKEGERFIYYQGVNRANGKKGEAHYFGTGTIGEIWQDPDPDRQAGGKIAWFCKIEDYDRFSSPVLAKINGENREKGPKNLFRDGVRLADPTIFESILVDAGLTVGNELDDASVAGPEEAQVIKASNLLVRTKRDNDRSVSPRRYSGKAKTIGDWAEQLVFRILLDIEGSSMHVHRAAIGETPGWDIDYVDASGVLHRVEVKGTQAAAFQSVEITANELKAAEQYSAGYELYLVARCLSDRPVYQVISNPARNLESGNWSMEPTSFRVSFVS